MSPARPNRWILSFADLCLLLLGFFVILHARTRDPGEVTRGLRSAFGDAVPVAARTDHPAGLLFEPGEAVLTPAARRWLAGLGARAARTNEQVLIVSAGADAATTRLDRWELAAARVAAAGRAVREGGLPEDRVILSIPSMGGAGQGGQTMRITAGPVQG